MKKSDLVKAMADQSGLTQKQVDAALVSLTDAIVTNVLKGGDSITLPGLGTFKQQTTAARTGRNPHTGQQIQISAKTKIAFKMASSLK